jgi:hypothetical protein
MLSTIPTTTIIVVGDDDDCTITTTTIFDSIVDYESMNFVVRCYVGVTDESMHCLNCIDWEH